MIETKEEAEAFVWEELDCGHSQASFSAWKSCLHPPEIVFSPFRLGGFAGLDFLSLPLQGDCLCAECRRLWAAHVVTADMRAICGLCAFDRLLSAERRTFS